MKENSRTLPNEDPHRTLLHNEIHARPQARIRLPVLVIFVAVLNHDISLSEELLHLRKLPSTESLDEKLLHDNFLRLKFEGFTLKWERHSEFTRYSLVQPLPAELLQDSTDTKIFSSLLLSIDWFKEIPGKVIAAIQLAMLHGDSISNESSLNLAAQWLGDVPYVASKLGQECHSIAFTDFTIRSSGFERILVISQEDSNAARVGRISQRLLELEIYRLMALRGLPLAKMLNPTLATAERRLADITAQLENKSATDQGLLDELVSLAAHIERTIAECGYRFSATRAYNNLVDQRIDELRERAIPGIQMIGTFVRRRLSPAINTVMAADRRLESLSERITRTSGLLRTRVDIATEAQNQSLLEKLTRGQELQLHLQSTVEGLSIAAIAYYLVSLILYASKAAKHAGWAIEAEYVAGGSIPFVLAFVWLFVSKLKRSLKQSI